MLIITAGERAMRDAQTHKTLPTIVSLQLVLDLLNMNIVSEPWPRSSDSSGIVEHKLPGGDGRRHDHIVESAWAEQIKVESLLY